MDSFLSVVSLCLSIVGAADERHEELTGVCETTDKKSFMSVVASFLTRQQFNLFEQDTLSWPQGSLSCKLFVTNPSFLSLS